MLARNAFSTNGAPEAPKSPDDAARTATADSEVELIAAYRAAAAAEPSRGRAVAGGAARGWVRGFLACCCWWDADAAGTC